MKFDVFLEGKSVDLICITKNLVEKHEGTTKERGYIDGKYVDRYNLWLLKPKWEKILKKW